MYNCGTWALTEALSDKLDRCQRKMIRRVLGLKWSDRVTNINLYARCGISPASLQVVNARWRLFGHILYIYLRLSSLVRLGGPPLGITPGYISPTAPWPRAR